ncbi:MAG: ABC transporter ATP-binding protein [Candidatus Coatesbacteria bacterium]
MILLETAGLTKVYGRAHGEVRALDGVSLAVGQGSFTVVTGGSGSGKTTLLLALGGLIRPTEGQVRHNGRDLYGLPERELAGYRNRSVGFVLQTFNLVPYLTAAENVMIPMLLNGHRPGGRRRKADALLDRLGMADRRDFLPRELSVGQQQRVAIARALANDPGIILADEPTGSLDRALAADILGVLSELHRKDGRTIVMVTHSNEAAACGDRRHRLAGGVLS